MDPRDFKTRHVRSVDFAHVQPHERSLGLESMQFAVVRLADGRIVVVAHANSLGGVCDDCTEFTTDDMVRADVFEVVAAEDPPTPRPRVVHPSDHDDNCNCELCR